MHCFLLVLIGTVTSNESINPEGKFGIQSIEAGEYAVFTLKGSYSGLSDLYQAIYLDWLTQSGMKLRNSMPFEKYLNNPDEVDEHELETEVYIPINN